MIDKKYLQIEYKHKRTFHSIALSSTKIQFNDLVQNIIGADFSKEDENKTTSKKWIIRRDNSVSLHPEVFLTKLTVPIDFASGSTESKHGLMKNYSYFIYFIEFPVEVSKSLIFISSPFINMARYLCDSLRNERDETRGKGIYFQRLNIDLMLKILSGRTDQEFLKMNNQAKSVAQNVNMTSLLLQIFGDPRNKIIGFKGENVPCSETYHDIIDSLSDKRIINFSCNLLFKKKGEGKFALEVDRFGRFSFRISEAAKNINSIYKIFQYLFKIGVIEEGTKVSQIRSSSQYWDLENSQPLG